MLLEGETSSSMRLLRTERAAYLSEMFFTYAAYQEKMLNPPKRTVFVAKLNDRLRSFSTDMREFLKLVGRSGIDVHSSGRRDGHGRRIFDTLRTGGTHPDCE